MRKLLAILLMGMTTVASAAVVPGTQNVQAHPSCWTSAATTHKVDVLLLYSIAMVESGVKSNLINFNKGGSYDLGMMQVNSIWHSELAKWGIKPADLLNPCVSIHTGAWILSKNIKRYGYSWEAVAAYNAGTPARGMGYAAKVANVYQKVRLQQQQAQLMNSQP